MAKGQSYSKHQKQIINRYYEHYDTIQIQKLGEIVSDLYLADTPKKADKLWAAAAKALDKVCEDKAWMANTLETKNLEQLAQLVNDISNKK